MKTASRQNRLAAFAAVCAVSLFSFSTVPLVWDAETSEPTIERFTQFRGTKIDFTANLKSYGRPLPVRGEPRLWWQTNGMDNLWWSSPAKVSGSRMSATFFPSNDCGAARYRCFIGIPKSIYSAAFELNFLGSPGNDPFDIPLPTRIIDFDSVEVKNAPWPTSEEVDSKVSQVAETSDTALSAATNAVNKLSEHEEDKNNPHNVTALQLGVYTKSESDAAISAATNGFLRAEADPAFRAWTNGTEVAAGKGAVAAHESVAIGSRASTSDETAPLYVGAVAVGPDSDARGHGAVAVGKEAKATDAGSVALGPGARSHGAWTFSVNADGPDKFYLGDASLRSFMDADAAAAKEAADAAYYPKADGELWAAWWSGDGFRVTVTNYNVAPAADVPWARLPSARFEYRPDGTNELRTVWDEETKWARWREEFAAATNRVAELLDLKAGLDWGRTTPTGFDAPEGFTWLDTPATVVAGGLAWQRTLTSEGAVWVLSSNGMVAQFGTDGASTNGYFRISNERGDAAFEVIAGGRVTVGAKAESVMPWTAEDGRTRLRVVYNVESDAAPTLHAAAKLLPGGTTDWKEIGAEGCAALAQGWTGGRGAWTNAVWLAEAPAAGASHSLFVYATYETGAEPVVRNLAPVQLEKIVLGGKTWTLGTATVSGKTVLTLEEAAP